MKINVHESLQNSIHGEVIILVIRKALRHTNFNQN